jgi:hypothetical protein
MAVRTRFRRAIASLPGARWLKRRLVGPRRPFPQPPPEELSPVPVSRPADRGPAPTADREALLASYRQSPLIREPDTFVLYRIIGNDLPPRHTAGQSLRNLGFILEHEPVLPDCDKRFVVNRIVDAEMEKSVLNLLDQSGCRFLHIPFEREVYRNIPWDIEGVPTEFAPWTKRFAELGRDYQGRALMRLYRHKNNYVMNNNGARNAALRDGRGAAKWVLPWDGNCFVTESAWDEITAAVRAAPELPYFIVPMARVTDNARLREDKYRPAALEEPQVMFRSNAALEFDPEYPYGRRPKVNLFWRLGVPGEWDSWSIEPWDPPCPPYAAEAGAFGHAGWVARLFSGQADLEAERDRTAFIDRGLARVEAIKCLLDQIDDSIRATALNRRRPCMIASSLADPNGRLSLSDGLRTQLRGAADQALTRGPYSVVHKTTLPPSGNRHDYWHPAPYYWPHPWRLPGRPYVRRDGRRVPGTRLYEPKSDRYDRTRLQRLFDDTFVLALAWRFFGDTRYAEHAARLVRTWFLAPTTAMNPHMEYAQVRWGHDNNMGSGRGIIEMKDVYFFLDGVRLLEHGEFLSNADQQALAAWFTQYLEWLRTSLQGQSERAAKNNHGTYYDLQFAAIAAYLGEARLVRDTLRDSRSRLLQQFDASGAQPEELRRTTTAHYCCFNLQGWIHLALLAGACGEDLWSFEGGDGRSIRRGMAWLLSHVGQGWPYPQIDDFNKQRFAPIFHAYAARFGAPAGKAGQAVASADRVSPLFFPHDGIMPFWQLAYK